MGYLYRGVFWYLLFMLIIPASASRNSARGIAGEKIRITEMPISEIEVSAVTIDGVEVFPALLLPGEWNGACNPVFSLNTVLAIADFFRDMWERNGGGVTYYDAVTDSFTFTSEEGKEVFESVTIAGRKFYGIGAGSWFWHALTEEEYVEAVPVFGHVYEALGALQDFKAEAGF